MTIQKMSSFLTGMTNVVSKGLDGIKNVGANESADLYDRVEEDTHDAPHFGPTSAQSTLKSGERLEHDTMSMIRGALYTSDRS